MSLPIKTIQPKSADLESFYSIGQTIRNRNDSFDLPWREGNNIHQFLNENSVEFQLWSVSENEFCGRIAAFYHLDDPTNGYIGWYECDADDKTANAILETALVWLQNAGVRYVFGPVNGTSWDNYRFNLSSDRPLFPGEPYQPLYYIDQWKKAGFKDFALYHTDFFDRNKIVPTTYEHLSNNLNNIGVSIKAYPILCDDNELKRIYQFYLENFRDNPFFRSISFDHYKKICDSMAHIANPEHSLMAIDQSGNPVSVIISLKDVYHDLWKKRQISNSGNERHTLYIKTIATDSKWRNNRISLQLVNYTCQKAFESGYEDVVFASMFSGNLSAIKSKERLRSENLRIYSVLRKEL